MKKINIALIGPGRNISPLHLPFSSPYNLLQKETFITKSLLPALHQVRSRYTPF